MRRAASRQKRNVPVKFVPMILFTAEIGVRSEWFIEATPALLMSTSSRPWCFLISENILLTAGSSPTSRQ